MGPAAFYLVLAMEVAATAGALGRPRECSSPGRASANVWERAKAPELRAYCDLLASGAAKLAGGGAGKDVLAVASQAARLRPKDAAPRILEGRALVELARFDEAVKVFDGALALDARAFDDPLAHLAFARALARTARRDEALGAFRAALPRASSVPAAERAAACFEAGLLALGAGKADLGDAVAYFRAARKDASDVLHVAAVSALVLALERSGSEGEARALVDAEIHGDVRPSLEAVRARGLFPRGTEQEIDALVAATTKRAVAARGAPPAASQARATTREGRAP